MGRIGCPEMSIRDCHYSLRHIPEGRRSYPILLLEFPFNVALSPTYFITRQTHIFSCSFLPFLVMLRRYVTENIRIGSSVMRWYVTLLHSGVSKIIVSSSTRVGALGPSQTRENPTAQRHFPIHPSHFCNNSGKHKTRSRGDVPWWILTMSEYCVYERHSLFSCSESCNDIMYKRIYAVDRS
jgi:hypothetical protein